MNKEFILLDDGNALVSDHTGKEEKRFFGNSFHKELLSENKKELIENKLHDEEKVLNENIKVKRLSKWMLACQPLVLIFCTLAGFLVGGFANFSNFLIGGLYQAIYAFVASGFCVAISSVYWSIFYFVYKKKIKKQEIKVETIKKIQKEFEKDNNRIKEHEYERRGVYPHQRISLEEDTKKLDEELDAEIESIYEDNVTVGLSLRKRKHM